MKDDVDKMKHRIKSILIPFMLLATLFFVAGCSGDLTTYDMNDASGHTVSVKYDANGGVFTGTSSIMVDSFKIADMEKDGSGMVNLRLLDPTDSSRGDVKPSNGNLVLAGWYKERTESTDSEGKKVYTYSGKFDFATDVVTVDPSKTYSSKEPVLTLYAVWIPRFEINFISMEDGETVLGTYSYNPKTVDKIQVPAWNAETGAIDMFKFPKIKGKTFEAAYYDAAGTQPVGELVEHTGTVDDATGTGKNTVMNLYVKYMEGEWYHIYNAKQFVDNASVSGNYILHADLDFSETFWPSSLANGKFTGSIQSAEGENYVIKNVSVEQNNIGKKETGLFGTLTAGSKISNVSFENVTLKISAGTRTPGAAFGLLAGVIDSGVELNNVQIRNSKVLISDSCFWGTPDFAIGLLCGVGDFAEGSILAGMDLSGITCEVVGDSKPVSITVEGNTVTLILG